MIRMVVVNNSLPQFVRCGRIEKRNYRCLSFVDVALYNRLFDRKILTPATLDKATLYIRDPAAAAIKQLLLSDFQIRKTPRETMAKELLRDETFKQARHAKVLSFLREFIESTRLKFKNQITRRIKSKKAKTAPGQRLAYNCYLICYSLNTETLKLAMVACFSVVSVGQTGFEPATPTSRT